MSDLEPANAQFLLAAIGWIELGLPAEADAELDRVPAPLQQHPDVLEVRWEICAALERWERGLKIAEALVAVASERATAWVHRAYSLRRSKEGSLQAAWDALRPAFEKFPGNSIIPYNLACYAALFGRHDEAVEWLQKAIQASSSDEHIKRMALADPDLKDLWARIKEL